MEQLEELSDQKAFSSFIRKIFFWLWVKSPFSQGLYWMAFFLACVDPFGGNGGNEGINIFPFREREQLLNLHQFSVYLSKEFPALTSVLTFIVFLFFCEIFFFSKLRMLLIMFAKDWRICAIQKQKLGTFYVTTFGRLLEKDGHFFFVKYYSMRKFSFWSLGFKWNLWSCYEGSKIPLPVEINKKILDSGSNGLEVVISIDGKNCQFKIFN